MYINRLVSPKILSDLSNKKICILLGARQVGKTTLIKHTLQHQHVAFINFDMDIDQQKFLAASKLPAADVKKFFGEADFLVIDEVQRLPESTRIIKGWYDSDIRMKIFLLGSSSFDIQNKMVESLTGRNIKIILTPLLFKEILAHQDWFPVNYKKSFVIEHFSSQIRTLLLQSLVFGNYPEVVTSANKDTLLINLANDYLFKDVLQLGLIKTPDLIKKLLMMLALQLGSEVSVNELANSLGISRITIDRYLFLLEQSFVIFRLPAFSTNPRKEIAKNQKIYFWDTGIRNALLNDFNFSEMRSDIGHLFENWVIAETAKLNAFQGFRQKLYFWRSRSGSEIDLVVVKDAVIKAYEIKWQKKKQRSNNAFTMAYNTPVQFVTSRLETDLDFF